jgi:hypothetical protein
MLTRDEILAKTSLKKQTVHVPEWAGDVIVSEMNGASRDEWEQSLQDRDSKGRLISPRAKLVIATVVDEAGNRMFTDKDTDAISKLSSSSLIMICDAAQKINKLLGEDLDEAVKN